TFSIDLANDGVNNLNDGLLSIRLDDRLDFALTDSNATLQSQTTVNGITTYLYAIDPLPVGGTASYSANITWPVNHSINSNALNMTYQANRTSIDDSNVYLNLIERTEAVLQLFQYSAESDAVPMIISPTEFLQSNNLYAPIPPPILDALGISVTSAPIPLKPATRFTHEQVLFIQLEDGDQNLNSTVRETVEVDIVLTENGEVERLKLMETTVNSGVFTGYITLNIDDSPQVQNGILNSVTNGQVNITYTDEVDNSDTSSQIILVDPFGILFDSSTGALLDGYTVSMVNADTGQPAQVFGDDGISSYPSTVMTGGSVTDSSGTVYNFAEGAYRFPFAPLGTYKLVVTPPQDSDYKWPSQKTTALINQLPNAPYVIVLGSRGETFPLLPGPPLQVDIPLDRLNAPLFIRRTASAKQVAPGDFIRFTVEIENTDKIAINNAILIETLPQGFRLEEASLRLEDNEITPLSLSETGQSFTLNLSNMDAGASLTLEYVVTIGAVNRGVVQSTSSASGNNGATSSNTARVETLVTEELMRSRAILMGQVIVSGEDDKSLLAENTPLKGIRIYLEDGRYAITDERGMYHFENIVPGLHVVQLDLDTLPPQYETVLTENNTRFSGRAWSQFVEVQGGTLWRSDFYVALKPKPQGKLSLNIENSELLDGDQIQYQVTLNSSGVSVTNKRLTVMIPPYTTYQADSATLQNSPISDPEITANILTFRLKDTPDKEKITLAFQVSGVSNSPASEMISKVFMVFSTPDQPSQRTPLVTHTTRIETQNSVQHITEKMTLGIRFGSADDHITANDQQILEQFAQKIKGLKNLRIHAVGHSDNRGLLPKTRKRFKDNMHLSENRAMVIANALRDLLTLPPSHVTIEGRGAKEPIADNGTPEGQRENRRVYLYIYSDKETSQIEPNSLKPQSSEPVVVTTQGSHVQKGVDLPKKEILPPPPIQASDFDLPWLTQQTAEVEWVYPPKEALPNIASTNIVVKHASSQRIHLVQNGQLVEAFNFEGTLRHEKGIAISTWRGVDLTPGNNHFDVIVVNRQGDELKRLSHSIHFSTDPVTAELIEQDSILIADGIQNPVIAIRLLDASGYPVRNGVKGSFKISPPYHPVRSKLKIDAMIGTLPEKYEYQVTKDGIALITLEPTTESGKIMLKLPLANERTVTLKPKLIAKSTPWILVGLAEGTLGYQTLKDKSIELTDNQTQSNLYQDNRVAFFAKGQIQGKWLLTLAYDSAKKRPNQTDPELFQTIDPDTYYTIYGDTAYNGSAAPSSEQLYLKLEQEQFYFLFGDYQTALNETQLSKYNRTLTGIKSHYQGERYDVIVFASRTNQAFVKDEFRAKGITGPYFLTRNNIALNSEKIIVEVRDRWRSENIVSTTELTRHQDYQIDYQTGELYFRTPIFSTDFDMNPQYIIVKYESFDSGDMQLTYGGRAKMAVTEALTLGASHINEGRTGGEARLDGLDVTYQITKAINVSAEVAQTTDNNLTTDANGSSYLVEIEHQTVNSQSNVYIRDQETGFGLGQTNTSENGLRKIGVDTRIKANENVTLKANAYQQTGANITRELLEIEGQSRFENTDFTLGARVASDQRNLDRNQNTQQLSAGIRHQFMDSKLAVRLRREQNMNDDDNIDFPNRTKLGASYRVTPKTSVFIEQDITDSALNDTRKTLLGIKASPWNGGELYSGVTQTSGSQGGSTSTNVSGRQTWQLNEQWRLQVGAEEVSVIDGNAASYQNEETPFVASIADEFTAGSIGVTYMPGNWMWTGRAEARNGSREDRWRLATSLQTNPNIRFSTLTTLAFSNRQQSSGQLTKESAIRFGFAYRPFLTAKQAESGSWLFLNKLDLKSRERNGNTRAENDWRIINNLNANYKRNRWQLSLQYAAKTVNETINNAQYNSFTDLIGFETRYDVTPKWDIGVHGNVLRSVRINQYDYNTGFSIGRTVSDNIWISAGYNLSGFYDEDFSRSRNTTEGAFLRFRIKFDQATVRDAVQWVGQ
ncbi:Adenylate cyclase, partial [hydrothermal vent metagenome]